MPSSPEWQDGTDSTRGPVAEWEEFRIAAIDQTWSEGRCVTSRQSWGMARSHARQLVASDRRDDELVALCNDAIAAAATTLRNAGALSRIVCRATREGGRLEVETTVVLSRNSFSLVTTVDLWREDDQLLQRIASTAPRVPPPHDLPLLWCHGSAAVLLHEAAGHAAEHGAPRLPWPHWLVAEDRSQAGPADLLAGEPPRALRRESFSDVPLRRMTSVVVRQSGAPYELPAERLEVMLVAGGAYDPVTDEVTIHVAAAEHRSGDESTLVTPFVLRAPRPQVAASFRGGSGVPERYPGVICSREGQELYVSSAAPLILTDPLPFA